MNLERFDAKKHYATIAHWWELHGLKPVPLSLLPAVGYFVSSTAAAFLYQTDSGVALIECLISSPESDKEYRNEAIDAIHEALIADAKKLGFQVVHAFTNSKAMLRRSKRHGYQVKAEGYTVLARGV